MQDVILAFAGLLTPMGGAFAWLYGNVSKKFAEINAKLAECEKRDNEKRDTLSAAAMGFVILSDELQGIQPLSPKVARISSFLRDSIPLEGEIPSTLKGLLVAIGEAERK